MNGKSPFRDRTPLGKIGGGLAGTVLLVVAALIVVPSAASSPPTATCTVDATIALSPGVTTTPRAQTGIGSGTTTCEGRVRGRSLDGSAPITLDTASTESCPGGSGTGTFTAGPLGPKGVTIVGDFEFTRTAFNDVTLEGTARIEGQGADKTFVIAGTFHYAFLQGNCVVTPITLVGTLFSPPFTISYR